MHDDDIDVDMLGGVHDPSVGERTGTLPVMGGKLFGGPHGWKKVTRPE